MRYAAGVVLTTLVIVVAIVLFGRAVSLPTRPHLDAKLDVVLGLVLGGLSVLTVVSRPRRGRSPSREAVTTAVRVVRAALGRRLRSVCSPCRRTSRR